MTPELITQLGMAGVFLVLLLKLWQAYKQMEKDKDTQIQRERDKKDEELKSMTTMLVAVINDMGQVLRENTTVQEGVRSAITSITSAIENNTQALHAIEVRQVGGAPLDKNVEG